MFLVDSVKFMPNTDLCLMVQGWQSHVAQSLSPRARLPHSEWKVNQAQKITPFVFCFYFFLDGNRSESQSSLSLFAEGSDATLVTRHRGARPVMQTVLPCVLGEERFSAHTGSSTDLWFLDLDPSPQEEP